MYASLGNHDRFEGEMPDLIEALEHSGMTVLYDEKLTVEGLTLVGRRDKQDQERAELSTLMDGADLSKPIFVLDHQPNALEEAQRRGVDLIVSGHTHRGQVFPAHLITQAMFENDWGYLQKAGCIPSCPRVTASGDLRFVWVPALKLSRSMLHFNR